MDDEPIRVCLVTFGCQMNKLDSRLLGGELVRAGYALSDEPEGAEVVIYNTCSVRAHAEDRVFSHLGTYRQRAEREERFVLGVVGCTAQRLGERIVERFPFVDLVCGTRSFLRVPEHLKRVLTGQGPVVDVETDGPVRFDRMPCMRQSGHSAYVSVMRGCDNFCSYCIVPHVRGREFSRPPGQIVEEVRALAAEGVREVTLLGQNVNSYGRKMPSGERCDLAGLLRAVSEVAGIWRIRFVTSHPKDMSDAVLEAVADLEPVCEHLHVPAQSGADAVLERMNRRYTAAQYRDMVRRARETIPGVALASDFIIGFPGETDEDFAETLRLLREVRFQQCFIFSYSPREGTRAAELTDDVPADVKHERHQRLLGAQEQVDGERRAGMVGRQVEVLVDGVSPGDPTRLSGRTRANDIVVFDGPESLTGELVPVRVVDSTALTLFGEVQNHGDTGD